MIFEALARCIQADLQIKIEEDTMIKKFTLTLSIAFIILTFIGAGYVLLNDGKVNAGYACVPMVFALISISFYRKHK